MNEGAKNKSLAETKLVAGVARLQMFGRILANPATSFARASKVGAGRRGASFRRAEVPFKSAQATRPSRPTGLADGLELESTPTRNGESAPRHPAVRMHWFPRSRAHWRRIRLHMRYYRSQMAV